MRCVRSRSLRTQASARKYLAWIRKVSGVESAADELHCFEVGLGEHLPHHHLFFFADAVLAGDRPAALHAEPQDIDREFHGAFFLTWDASVIEHEGMQI